MRDGDLIRKIALQIMKAVPSEHVGTEECSIAMCLAMVSLLDAAEVPREAQLQLLRDMHKAVSVGGDILEVDVN